MARREWDRRAEGAFINVHAGCRTLISGISQHRERHHKCGLLETPTRSWLKCELHRGSSMIDSFARLFPTWYRLPPRERVYQQQIIVDWLDMEVEPDAPRRMPIL